MLLTMIKVEDWVKVSIVTIVMVVEEDCSRAMRSMLTRTRGLNKLQVDWLTWDNPEVTITCKV